VTLTDRELATVLAALRYWQDELDANEDVPIPEHFAEHAPLTAEEIDGLCERLYTDDDGVGVRCPGCGDRVSMYGCGEDCYQGKCERCNAIVDAVLTDNQTRKWSVTHEPAGFPNSQ
jgi:hypothetical protein